MPAIGSISYSVACESGTGSVTVTLNGATGSSYTIELFDGGGIVASYGTAPGSYTFTGIADGGYGARGINNDNSTTEYETATTSEIGVSCAGGGPDPDPDPEPDPEIPGTATPPAAKYQAVGGTLSNPIEYAFAFQVNNAAGVPKTGHYVIVNIYKEAETTPSATARARIKDGAAKVDVSRYVQAMLSITPPAGTDIIQADAGALVRYHIGFVEVWAGVTMAEVMVGDKYAVNAALQSLVNNFTDHVIWPAL